MKNENRIYGDTMYITIHNTSDKKETVYLFGTPKGKKNSDDIKIEVNFKPPATGISYEQILERINGGLYGSIEDIDICIHDTSKKEYETMYINFHSENTIEKIQFIEIPDPYRQPSPVKVVLTEDREFKMDSGSYFELTLLPKTAWTIIYYNNPKSL